MPFPQGLRLNEQAVYTSVRLGFDADMIGTKDIQVLSDEGLPEGLSVSAAGVVTGRAAEVGEAEVTLKLLLDNWVKATATVKIIVEAAQ